MKAERTETCPTCGSPVSVVSDGEGTNHYEPAQAPVEVTVMERLLREAALYVQAFGISGSAPVVYDRKALDEASDQLMREIRAVLSQSGDSQ